MPHIRDILSPITAFCAGAILSYSFISFLLAHQQSDESPIPSLSYESEAQWHDEEITDSGPEPFIPSDELVTYLEVTDGCGPSYDESCVYAYAGPSELEPRRAPLRMGTVLPVMFSEVHNGRTWHVVTFPEPLRYPDRVLLPWYIPSEHVTLFEDTGTLELGTSTATSTQVIRVSLGEQMLRAYEDGNLVMEFTISSGIVITPTPQGAFTVYRKTPSRYMQGPLPGISAKTYDLPGVPWNLYFTKEGGVIHGTYWHDKFGVPWSNGCINLPYEQAKILYHWADLGTSIIVTD